MDKVLSISININGIKDKWVHIKTLLQLYTPLILFIIESNISNTNQIRQFQDYNSNLWIHTDYKLNILTYINNSYHIQEQPNQQTENINTAAYKTEYNSIQLNIMGIYIKSGTLISNNIQIPQPNPILVGDMNARCISFGDTSSNRAGTKLREFTLANNLKLINFDTPYTFHQKRRNKMIYSKLDLVFSNNNLIIKGLKADTLEEIDSDHLPIVVKLGKSPIPKAIEIKQYNKTNWTEYASAIDAGINLLPTIESSVESINQAIDELTSLINRTTNRLVPKKRIKTNIKIEDTIYIKQLKSSRNRINKILYNNRNNSNPQLISMKNKINEIIRNYYIDCSMREQNKIAKTLNTEKGTDKYWNLINSILNGKNINNKYSPLLDQNNKPHFAIDKKLEIFQNYYNNIFKEIQISPIPEHQGTIDSVNNYFHTNSLDNEENFEEITEQEINITIKQKKNKSAPGPDSIHNLALKNLSNEAVKYITKLVNSCYKLAYFPEKWRISHITNICKPGKPSTMTTSYRPISLLSSLGKILESVIQTRLHKHILEHNIIRDEQHGFMPTRGTTDAILSLVETMAEGIKPGSILPTTACFFDMQKAFDTVWHSALINTLINYNFSFRLINLIRSFLNNRSAKVKLEGILSNTIKIEAGVPQGSVIAPTLYILFINKFPANHIANPNNMEIEMNRRRHIFQYADDTTISLSAATRNGAQQCLGAWLKLITSWCHINKVRINPSKSVQILFKNALRRTEQQQPAPLTLNGEMIPINATTKYLGVNINKFLSWNVEITSRINKSKAHLHTMRSLKYKGVNSSTLLHIYKSKIRPLLTHTTPVLGLINKTNLKKIEVTERKYLQIITKPLGAYRNLSNNQLYQNNKIIPIKTHIEQSIKRYLLKNHSKKALKIRFIDSPMHKLYRQYWPDAPLLANIDPG